MPTGHPISCDLKCTLDGRGGDTHPVGECALTDLDCHAYHLGVPFPSLLLSGYRSAHHRSRLLPSNVAPGRVKLHPPKGGSGGGDRREQTLRGSRNPPPILQISVQGHLKPLPLQNKPLAHLSAIVVLLSGGVVGLRRHRSLPCRDMRPMKKRNSTAANASRVINPSTYTACPRGTRTSHALNHSAMPIARAPIDMT
jgi:hypothetical protein